MPEQKPCIRCQRPIDPYARLCVYCNWDQANTHPDQSAFAPAAPPYVPPPDNRIRNRFFAAVAIGALVIVFMIGSLVRASSENSKAAQAALQTTQDSEPHSTVTLVPVEGGDSLQPESPVTTAPVQSPSAGNVEVNGERTDATALPSDAYSAAARRASAERALRTTAGPVDPRTIGGSIEPRHARSVPAAPAQADQATQQTASLPHTKPIPLYRPVPSMSVDRSVSARLFLTIGSDGRVHDINVGQSIPGEMPRLIASVQNWRYKPATLNGEPVTSTLTVDINVNPR
ncbi:MAG: energy transducer TonB [Thermoanaerobaculia bacterium]